MSFVFISHANEDKPRIRPIVDALLVAGHKVFLDNPDRAGYVDNELDQFYRLHADKSWEAQLHEALRECACVLVCWSVRATDKAVWEGHGRRVWMAEIDYARIENKGVYCIVDDTEPSRLPGNYSSDQSKFLNTDQMDDQWRAALRVLLQDVERVIDRKMRGDPGDRGARGQIDLPLLANRGQQEDAFYTAIESASAGGVFPIALKGPRNELPRAFLERMERTSSLMRPDGGSWFSKRIDWPRQAQSTADFAKHYRAQLWRKLELKLEPGQERSPENQDRHIAENLAERDLTAIVHDIDPKNWRRREEPELIRAWMDYWLSLAALGARLKVVPILVVPFPAAKPGWRDCPGGRTGGRVGVKEIWKTIKGFSGGDRPASGLSLTLPPVLAPIRDHHAEAWMLDELGHLDAQCRSEIEEKIGQIYRNGRARKHGIPHQEFHEALKSLCAGARARAA